MASTRLTITGMHCDHCVTKVKDALQGVKGVWGADVQLDEGRAEVDFDDSAASADQMIDAVKQVGYGAKVAT